MGEKGYLEVIQKIVCSHPENQKDKVTLDLQDGALWYRCPSPLEASYNAMLGDPCLIY